MRGLTWAGLAIALTATPASAAPKWTLQHESFGKGNSIIAIGAGTGVNAVAYGQKQQQGSSAPLLLYTNDGGVTWTEAPTPSQFFLIVSISMPNEKIAYAGGMGLFKSNTGGSSFTEVKLPSSGGGPFSFIFIQSVFATDPNHVFAVSENKVYYTANSLNWDWCEPAIDVTFATVYFLDSQHGWIGGGKAEEITEVDPHTGKKKVVGHKYLPSGIVMETQDGGKTFVPRVIGADEYFLHLMFPSPEIGLAVTASNDVPLAVKRSTDGGTTWMPATLPSLPEGQQWLHLSRIQMVSPSEGWIAGTVGNSGSDLENLGNKAVVLHTVDGGETWEFVKEAESSGGYIDIAFPGPHWGWVVGTFGKIMAYTDGVEWEPASEPNVEVIEQPGPDATFQDVPVWSRVFGVFGDEVLISERPSPGGPSSIVAGKDNPACKTVSRSSGCSASPLGSGPVSILLPLLLLLLGHGFITTWSYKRPPLCGARHRVRWGCFALFLLLVSCAAGEPIEVCEELPGFAARRGEDVHSLSHEGGERAPFRCGLAGEMTPANFVPVKGRLASKNDLIVFVRTRPEGGSDLFLSTPDGKTVTQLTEFNDPSVQVWNPSWSPDRSHIAFVSNFRGVYNVQRNNLFLISLDRARCYQLTPGIKAAALVEPSSMTAVVTGSVRYSKGAIANPVAGATVAFPGASTVTLTGPAGEFILNVPPGKGVVVARGVVNGVQVKGVAEYNVKEGESLDLGPIMTSVEGEYRLGRPAWSNTGTRLFVLESGELERLISVDANTGQISSYLESENDKVLLFTPFPDAQMALVVFKSDPETYFIYSLEEPPAVLYQLKFGGQTESSVVAMSPMRFLATLRQDRLIVLGADPFGHLETYDVTPDNLSEMVEGQLDWSPSGTMLLVTVSTGGKTNLVEVNVNDRTVKALTSDGAASMPAWFGY